MSDIFSFASSGLDPDIFRVLRFSGTEAVSECYGFTLELLALNQFDIQALYDTDASFTVSRQDGSSTTYRGRVASVAVEQVMSAGYFKCRASLVPHLWFYTLRKSSKAYVGKTIEDIINAELKENGEGVSGGFIPQFDQLPLTKFPLVIKYHETPLEFISRLLQRECLYYYFLAEEGMDTLKFSSDSKLYSNEVLTAKVINELAFSALGVDDERILSKSAHMAQAKRSEPVNLYAFDGNPNSVETLHGIGRTAIEKNMLAPLRDISNIRRTQDSRSSLRYTMATSVRGARVGIVHDGLRALSLRHDGDQSSAVLESLGLPTESNQQDFYRNQGIWMPEGEAYIPEWILEAPRIANATLTGFTTKINADGTYDVRCHSIDTETDLPNVRMMFPFAGQKGNASGLHLPLVDGTEVLLEFLEGDPDRPVILGSLYNTSVNSPVTVINKHSHILETPQGQKVHLIDGGQNMVHIEGQSRVEAISQQEMVEIDSGLIGGPYVKAHSTKLIELHADNTTQLVLDGAGDTVNLQAGDAVAMDMDLRGLEVDIKAQETSATINGKTDDITLETAAETKAVIAGSSNEISLLTQPGAKTVVSGKANNILSSTNAGEATIEIAGDGTINIITKGGPQIVLSKGGNSAIIFTNSGGQVTIDDKDIRIKDGKGQHIHMEGGNTDMKFKDMTINTETYKITGKERTEYNWANVQNHFLGNTLSTYIGFSEDFSLAGNLSASVGIQASFNLALFASVIAAETELILGSYSLFGFTGSIAMATNDNTVFVMDSFAIRTNFGLFENKS